MPIKFEEKQRFYRLRRKLFAEIEKQLKEDPCCKSYEGAFEITQCFPDYFEDEQGEENASCYVIKLHCYVIGPHRHYEWYGKTFLEALQKAEKEILSWL